MQNLKRHGPRNHQKIIKLCRINSIHMIVEICCSSKISLNHSIEGGASRIELCENVLEDGLTPSPSFLKYVLETAPFAVHVLIRPRKGNFTYSREEIKTTESQIERAKSLGAQGIVMGALNEDGSLPMEVLRRWVTIAQPLDLTFHRAFDHVIQPMESLKKIMDLGFDRVLTSGKQPTATLGLALLKDLQALADEQIVIMPGGGLNDQNCDLFFKEGFREIHLSAKGKEKTKTGEPISDLEIIKKVVDSASNYSV